MDCGGGRPEDDAVEEVESEGDVGDALELVSPEIVRKCRRENGREVCWYAFWINVQENNDIQSA